MTRRSTTAGCSSSCSRSACRVEEEDAGALPGRRGGAGPSDALFLWVRGLPLTVPAHAALRRGLAVRAAPQRRKATLYRDDELVGPVTVPRRPRIYDMETADGIPYWKIALLHLDSIASTVVQKCIYWGTHEQCGVLRDRAHARRADDPGQDAGPARGGVHGGARPTTTRST